VLGLQLGKPAAEQSPEGPCSGDPLTLPDPLKQQQLQHQPQLIHGVLLVLLLHPLHPLPPWLQAQHSLWCYWLAQQQSIALPQQRELLLLLLAPGGPE